MNRTDLTQAIAELRNLERLGNAPMIYTTDHIGASVRDTKWGGTYTGTITNVEDGSVFVQWHGSCVEDQLDPGDIELAPDVPRPDEDGFQPLIFFGRQLLQAAPATSIDYTIPGDRPTVTVGEIRKLIANLPDDRPVTMLAPDDGGWINIIGFQNNADPDRGEEPAAMFTTRDDFDTRQW